MEFHPDECPCFLLEEYEIAAPRKPGILGLEVIAQVRNNSCIVNHFLASAFSAPTLSPLSMEFPPDKWPCLSIEDYETAVPRRRQTADPVSNNDLYTLPRVSSEFYNL